MKINDVTNSPEDKLKCDGEGDEGCTVTSDVWFHWGKPPMRLCVACWKALVGDANNKVRARRPEVSGGAKVLGKVQLRQQESAFHRAITSAAKSKV